MYVPADGTNFQFSHIISLTKTPENVRFLVQIVVNLSPIIAEVAFLTHPELVQLIVPISSDIKVLALWEFVSQKIMKNLNFLVSFTLVHCQQRRYNQLTTLMKNYWSDYKETNFWGYGCNCLNTNDRPMSSPGIGRPVDALDRHCMQYKQWYVCWRITFSE